MGDNLAAHLRLMLVTDDGLLGGRDPEEVLLAAVRGGVTSVQLRLKTMPDRDLLALARRLRRALPVPLLLNDRPDLALAAGTGVHLGPEDLAVPLARRILGPGPVIGASVGQVGEIPAALEADYWGVGPLRTTVTKSDAGQAIGVGGLADIIARAGGRPCVAIGGVRPEDVKIALGAGAAGVAVIAGILGGTDVEQAARAYAAEF